jgi:methylthioribose-1-phosphate isomerase
LNTSAHQLLLQLPMPVIVPRADLRASQHDQTIQESHMKPLTSFALALAIAAASTHALAANADQRSAQGPAGTASTPAARYLTNQSRTAAMEGMAAHMKSMHEMHEKLMAAKTPEERNALMPEHLQTMQDGMAMMKEMSSSGGRHFLKGNPTSIQLMDKRMEMMEAMMEMIMDRVPPAPSK